jgi:cardiolipin synthase
MAQERLWITDPYFVAPGAVAEAMVEAAQSGVDVRVLVPANNNWPLVGTLSRAGYRYLLEQGVRLFEWQGAMIHAKTSVADGLWCRVGSSNLNAWSLLGNWEIDVGILDASLAGQLEGIFLADLASSSEIVLPGRHPTHAVVPTEPLPMLEGLPTTPLEPEGKLTERLEAMMDRETVLRPWRLAQLVRAGVSFSDALAGHRVLGREDRTILGTVAIIAISSAVVVGFFPLVFGWALALVLAWLGTVMGFRAAWHRFRAQDANPPDVRIKRTIRG